AAMPSPPLVPCLVTIAAMLPSFFMLPASQPWNILSTNLAGPRPETRCGAVTGRGARRDCMAPCRALARDRGHLPATAGGTRPRCATLAGRGGVQRGETG